MARLLLWLIPLALFALAVWLPSLLPSAVLVFVGWTALSVAGIAGVGLVLMHGYAQAMRS